MMKRLPGNVLKIAGLGVFLWSLSLLWPDVNLILTPPVMARVVVLVSGLALGLALAAFWYARHKQLASGLDPLYIDGPARKKIDQERHPSRPLHISSV